MTAPSSSTTPPAKLPDTKPASQSATQRDAQAAAQPATVSATAPEKGPAPQATIQATAQPDTQPAHGPVVCPECGRANAEGVEFCTHCHHTLLFRCPMCWNVQRHGGTCDKCHLDLDRYWRVKGATEHAQLVRDEALSFEKYAEPPRSVLLTLLAIPLQFMPFGEWLGGTLLLNWLRKRYPDLL
jgi:hypothetical protein